MYMHAFWKSDKSVVVLQLMKSNRSDESIDFGVGYYEKKYAQEELKSRFLLDI